MACYNKTDKYLNNIYYRSKNVKCKNLELKRKLCSMYDGLVAALHESGKSFDVQRKHKRKHNIRPGWKEHVTMYQDEVRVAYKLWAMAVRPKQGPEFEWLANA